jgi:hypothetical protein
MSNVTGIDILGCSFINSRAAADLYAHYRGIGIYSIESQYNLSKHIDFFNTDTTYNYFKKLNYGVKSVVITPTRSNTIEHSSFNANITGIYLSGIANSRITECSFAVESFNTQYNDYIYCGLYLDNCTGYHVEGNWFYDSLFNAVFRPDTVIGITVNNSGGAANEIYRNHFDNLDIGILAQNSNRNAQNTYGLVLKCNDFGAADANLGYDIAVTAYQGCQYPGIYKFQGFTGGPSTPAGNMFSHNGNGALDSDYHNESQGIFYYQHIPDPERLDMERYTPFLIRKEQTDQSYTEESCPSNISIYDINMLKDEIAENENKADSVDLLLDALVDGGDTPALESSVILSTPDEAYELHTDLMNKSPYLTDTVMIEAINKEDVLNPVMVKEILVANPQAAKSEEVMTELDNRMNPLPDYMVSEIEQGKDTLGDKELMEASKSHYLHNRAMHMNMLKSIYKWDTLGLSYSDSLIALLSNENKVEAKYELAFEYIINGEYATASTVLNNIPNQFTLDDDQINTHQQYIAFMPIAIDLYQNNKSVMELDSTQFQLLDSLATDIYSFPSAFARNIMFFTGKLAYEEPYILPDTSLKAEALEKPYMAKENLPPKFKIYPNPAGNYLVIEYNLEMEGCDGIVLFRDNMGKTVKAVNVSSDKYSMVISTSEIISGVYYVSLLCDEQLLATEKLIIQQ